MAYFPWLAQFCFFFYYHICSILLLYVHILAHNILDHLSFPESLVTVCLRGTHQLLVVAVSVFVYVQRGLSTADGNTIFLSLSLSLSLSLCRGARSCLPSSFMSPKLVHVSQITIKLGSLPTCVRFHMLPTSSLTIAFAYQPHTAIGINTCCFKPASGADASGMPWH
jgi:hypothetical protein